MTTTSPRYAVGALVLSFTLAVVGCSSDDSSPDATTTSSGGSEPSGDAVEIPQVDVSEVDDYVVGTDVAVGQTADAGGLLITVESISAGDETPEPDSGAATTINVAATVENTTDLELAGPDVYTVCADDGRGAIALETSEIASLETVPAGGSLGGTYVVGVPDDCTEVLLQARVLPTEVGGDHIAQWAVPPDVLS